MTREDKKEEKLRYKAYAFRLHEGTNEALKALRIKEDISWNRLIYKLIKTYENRK